MTDIVDRLRETPGVEAREAADEIEWLRELRSRKALDYLTLDGQATELMAENERLRHQVASHSADFLKVYGAWTAEREENERLRGLLREARDLFTEDVIWIAFEARCPEFNADCPGCRAYRWGEDVDAALGEKHD